MFLHGRAFLAGGYLSLAISFFTFQNLAAQKLQPITGRTLFEREWQINDPLCPNGDGLGPCFNAASCAACHHQGGAGGGGDLARNVDLLTLRTPPEDVKRIFEKANRKPLKLHPSFLEGQMTIILHASGVYSDYEIFRHELLGVTRPHDMSPAQKAKFWANVAKRERHPQAKQDVLIDGVHLQRTQRNTPALFGAGLIDSIPEADVLEVERQQAKKGSSVSGRVGRAKPAKRDPFADKNNGVNPRDTVGKFGWRAQTANLADFVLGACANEVGLTTPGHQQPIDPLRPSGVRNRPDLDEDQCRKLIDFVRSLPRPRQIKPRDPKGLAEIERGEALFRATRCDDCHQPSLGGVDGLYSDLLLHDMGPVLSDPLPAAPQIAIVGSESFSYYGSTFTRDVFAKIPTETQQEWRTPPLWGVADSAPYLHDGRAVNLHQAIMLHGGEAADSRARYVRHSDAERRALLAFLETLRAPR